MVAWAIPRKPALQTGSEQTENGCQQRHQERSLPHRTSFAPRDRLFFSADTLVPPPFDYCSRIAMTGSSRMARRAGAHAAPSATRPTMHEPRI